MLYEHGAHSAPPLSRSIRTTGNDEDGRQKEKNRALGWILDGKQDPPIHHPVITATISSKMQKCVCSNQKGTSTQKVPAAQTFPAIIRN
jgi:hypothetical protein